MPPRSNVWKHFTKLLSDSVHCNICKVTLKFAGGSTGSMKNHLTAKHPTTLSADNANNTSSSIKAHFSRQATDPVRAEKIRGLIAKMVAKDMLPFHAVEGEGFKELVEFLAPGFDIPVRNTVKAHASKLYEDVKVSVKEKLKDAEWVSLTTDLWTSLATDSYMTVTAHFVTEEWEIKTFVLCTKEITERHTASELAEQLTETIGDWELTTKIVAVVHDNASNIVNIASLCDLDCQPVDVRCAAHTFQLCVNKGIELPMISRLLGAASRLVQHFKKSPTATNSLEKKQEAMDVKRHALMQRCKTRWNSDFFMLERLLEQRWAVCTVLSDRTSTKLSDARTLELKDEQWLLAEDLITVLQPLQVATTVLSGESYASASVVLPIMSGLLSNHLKVKTDDKPAIRDFKTAVSTEIRERFCVSAPQPDSIFLMTSAIDPRHKLLTFLSEPDKRVIYDTIEAKLSMLSPPRRRRRMDSPEQPAHASTVSSTIKPNEAMSFLLKEKAETQVAIRDSEYKQFLLEPKLDVNKSILNWWRENEIKYPQLVKLGKKYLCIPATSVPSERVFSCAGQIVIKKRSALLPENVDMLVFLAENLKKNSM